MQLSHDTSTIEEPRNGVLRIVSLIVFLFIFLGVVYVSTTFVLKNNADNEQISSDQVREIGIKEYILQEQSDCTPDTVSDEHCALRLIVIHEDGASSILVDNILAEAEKQLGSEIYNLSLEYADGSVDTVVFREPHPSGRCCRMFRLDLNTLLFTENQYRPQFATWSEFSSDGRKYLSVDDQGRIFYVTDIVIDTREVLSVKLEEEESLIKSISGYGGDPYADAYWIDSQSFRYGVFKDRKTEIGDMLPLDDAELIEWREYTIPSN